MLRKNYENFVLLKHKQALVTPGPKKAKDFPRGLIVAYPSGHIISAATRQHFVGLAPPEGFRGGAPKQQQPQQQQQQQQQQRLRRKLRSHETEPSCAANGSTRFLSLLCRADLSGTFLKNFSSEIFLEEFHDYIKLHLQHWAVVYDPE
ncbi:hypothetical protein, conserved, partial [Eimeria tenella]